MPPSSTHTTLLLHLHLLSCMIHLHLLSCMMHLHHCHVQQCTGASHCCCARLPCISLDRIPRPPVESVCALYWATHFRTSTLPTHSVYGVLHCTALYCTTVRYVYFYLLTHCTPQRRFIPLQTHLVYIVCVMGACPVHCLAAPPLSYFPSAE
jgi:hypothetical protein